MRITGGKARSRKISSPKPQGKGHIRPTSDRVREALFSILGDKVKEARVLDLYAGTGSFGLDALSRGASLVVFVDGNSQSLKLIHQNLQNCFDDAPAEIQRLNLEKPSSYETLDTLFMQNGAFDIIFIDPPYDKEMAETTLTMIAKTGLFATNGVVIAEERWKVSLPEHIGTLDLQMQRRYGETGIWMYNKQRD